MLKTEKTISAKQPQRNVAKASATSNEYWASVQSYYDEDGNFITDGNFTTHEYTVSMTFDGEDVAIDGLVDLYNFESFAPTSSTIKGHYDADAHTLTIQTPPYDDTKSVSDYTKVATMSYYGTDMTLALLSGEWAYDDDGEEYLSPLSELVFDVSEDLSTITARNSFGCVAVYDDDGSNAGFIDYYDSFGCSILSDEANLSCSPSLITFDGASVTVGATLYTSIFLTNKSLKDTEFTVDIQGEGLQVYTSYSIDAKAVDECEVVFKPAKAGEYEGCITFTAPNGSTATTLVKANVAEAPDFSKIVKEGDFTFANADDSPFTVTDTITGTPVAVTTFSGQNYTSTLVASFEVPEGQTGVLSWKGTSLSVYPNGTSVMLDNDEVYNDVYAHNGVLYHDDLANMCVVGSGSHTLSFTYYKYRDWYQYGYIDEELKAWIYDLSLTLAPTKANAAVLKDSIADFGRHYFDKFSVSDTVVVNLLNAGTSDLTLTGATGTDNFNAIVDGAAAAYGEVLPVSIVFGGNAIDDYNGEVLLHTTADDFSVDCTSSMEKIIYDYSPIVSEGDFSFNTSFDYPFIVENDSAKSNVSGIDPTGIDLIAWLEASFEVPEGQEGTLSWRAHNSSMDWFEYMDMQIFENGTYITLDGTNKKEFCGEDENCSSNVWDNEALVFQPGRHNVLFTFVKMDPTVAGYDRLSVSNLALHLQTTGIKGVSDDKKVVRTERYTVDGKRIDNAQKGLNIIRKVYADGTSDTCKQFVK